jgi:subtilisin family serine protease
MMFSEKYPVRLTPGILLALFSFVLISASAGQAKAGNTNKFTRNLALSGGQRAVTPFGLYGQTPTLAGVKKRKSPIVGGSYLSGRKFTSEYNRKPPTGSSGGNRGGGHRGGGSSIGITIDVGRLLQQMQKQPPPPPRKVYSKPKRKKKTSTARRRPPRKQVRPPVLKMIPQFIPNEILVFVTSDQAGTLGAELAATFNLNVVETVPVALLEGSIIRFRYPDNRPLRDVIASLTSDPRVSQAQPNNYYHPVAKKKRKRRSKKPNPQYGLAKMSVGPAHKISQGRDVRVAVIDTGIDARHPVLSKSIAMSFDAVGDGKKTVDRHGTAIAGLIAGQGKVKGVAPLSRLLAVRAFTMHREYNKPMTSGLILLRSFDWSFANKARVFNMSFSGPYDPLVKKALESAYEKGVILVAAAGNGGAKAAPAYPAAYENVIAITALDNKDKLYVHANRGEYVTVAAPGVDMLVPSVKKGYRYSSGTSLAAAQISGLIALLLEKNPDATSEAIVDAIKNSARDLGPKGYDTQFGAGLADAHASLLSLISSQ